MTTLITCFAVLLVAGYLITPAAPCENPWGAQVEHDIHHFKFSQGAVTRAALDSAETEILSGFRVLILQNALYAIPIGWQVREKQPHGRRGLPHEALLLILKALCRHKIPDVEFVMNIQAERGTSHALHSTAVFSYTKDSRNQRWDFLYPYWNVLWPDNTRALIEAHKVPWSQKVPKAVWRGAPSAGGFSPHGWRNNLRVKLVKNCQKRPDLCDAGFISYNSRVNDEQTRREMRQELGVSKRISMLEHIHYKYLILCDGATAPTSRTVHYMHMNSTVFRAESDLQEFYDSDLQPGVHYIPLTFHVSDLIDKLEWAKAHDDECRKIAQNAYEYAAKFTDENLACYWKHLLTEYAGLQSFAPQLTPEFARFKFQPAAAPFNYVLDNLGYPCTQAPWSTYKPR